MSRREHQISYRFVSLGGGGANQQRSLVRRKLAHRPRCSSPSNALRISCTPIQARVLQFDLLPVRARDRQSSLRDCCMRPLAGECWSSLLPPRSGTLASSSCPAAKSRTIDLLQETAIGSGWPARSGAAGVGDASQAQYLHARTALTPRA